VLEVRVRETRRTVDCLVSPAVGETFLGLDWMRASEAEWSFGRNSITVGGCQYPLLTSRDIRRSREEVRVSTCRVVEPRASKIVPLMSMELEEKFVMPRWMEPPRKWRRPTSNKKAREVQRAMSMNITESREAEPAIRSDPPVEPTPSVTEALENPVEITAMSSEGGKSETSADPTPSVTEALESPEERTEVSSGVDKAGSIVEPAPSVTEVQETLEEAAVKLMRVETDERHDRGEQKWELPEWFKQRQRESVARHAERRRSGMRLGMWGFPLEARAQSSTC
jgi:hypothetical protein